MENALLHITVLSGLLVFALGVLWKLPAKKKPRETIKYYSHKENVLIIDTAPTVYNLNRG